MKPMAYVYHSHIHSINMINCGFITGLANNARWICRVEDRQGQSGMSHSERPLSPLPSSLETLYSSCGSLALITLHLSAVYGRSLRINILFLSSVFETFPELSSSASVWLWLSSCFRHRYSTHFVLLHNLVYIWFLLDRRYCIYCIMTLFTVH